MICAVSNRICHNFNKEQDLYEFLKRVKQSFDQRDKLWTIEQCSACMVIQLVTEFLLESAIASRLAQVIRLSYNFVLGYRSHKKLFRFTNLKKNEAQSARAESAHKGVN